jgi:hypothetical protein
MYASLVKILSPTMYIAGFPHLIGDSQFCMTTTIEVRLVVVVPGESVVSFGGCRVNDGRVAQRWGDLT